jgi:quinol monooxygenase YgiN
MSLYSRAETQAQSIKVLNTTEKASVAKYESDGTLVAHDGNTNATAGAEGNAAIQSRVVFIDDVEATLAENTERGLNAPGWWQYTSYTDASGETRHKCQHLAAFKDAPANTADSDDDVAADAASAITISAQPADVGAAADPFTGTFAVTAAADAGTLEYQWQRQTATSTRWVNITGTLDGSVYSGQTGATLTITGAAKADLDGYKYRVKLTSDAGAEEVISDAATLTFA